MAIPATPESARSTATIFNDIREWTFALTNYGVLAAMAVIFELYTFFILNLGITIVFKRTFQIKFNKVRS